MQELELKLKGREGGLYKSSIQLNPCPMMLYNSKCFFCNQPVKCKFCNRVVSSNIREMFDKKSINRQSFPKEVTGKVQGYGNGYSHVLNSLHIKQDNELPNTSNLNKRLCRSPTTVECRNFGKNFPLVKSGGGMKTCNSEAKL